MRTVVIALAVTVAASSADLAVVNRIKAEEFQNSKVMDILQNISDHYGPRLTGSPEGEFQAEAPLTFFTSAVPGFDITLRFEAAPNRPPSALVFSVNGVETRAVRTNP